MAQASHSDVIQLAEHLSDGFAALSGEYQILLDQQRQLESKLSWAKQQYLDFLKKFTPQTVSQDHLNFLQALENVTYEQVDLSPNWLQRLDCNEDIARKARASAIRQAQIAAGKLGDIGKPSEGVRIWSGPSADKDNPPSLHARSNMSSTLKLEKDFTTPGIPSRLGCPFARGTGRERGSPLATPRSSISRTSAQGRRSKRPSFHDPIRAEICGNDPVSSTASVEGSAAVCPIRFLDQHSPEEVAKYFENHKHELPRSHEVCVKRFQSNAESIRQLDAKYGNLVTMIQGLGQKHQPWLPKEPDDMEDAVDEAGSTEKVAKWAKAVSASLQEGDIADAPISPQQVAEEERSPRFDRPLKEIRVGESPSRPWGITIPVKYMKGGTSSVKSPATASPPLDVQMPDILPETPAKPTKCPFNHTKLQRQREDEPMLPKASSPEPQTARADIESSGPASHAPLPKANESSHGVKQGSPNIVINGPVFIGYSSDQIVTFLQQSNLGARG